MNGASTALMPCLPGTGHGTDLTLPSRTPFTMVILSYSRQVCQPPAAFAIDATMTAARSSPFSNGGPVTPSPDLTELDRMRPPAEARAIIDQHTPRLEPEPVPIAEAAGRILAVDLLAPGDHPPFPASTMDGYAVFAADSSPWREVIAEQHAGNVVDVEVTEGYTVRIMTGAPVPRGADAVVPVEATAWRDDHVVIHPVSYTHLTLPTTERV